MEDFDGANQVTNPALHADPQESGTPTDGDDGHGRQGDGSIQRVKTDRDEKTRITGGTLALKGQVVGIKRHQLKDRKSHGTNTQRWYTIDSRKPIYMHNGLGQTRAILLEYREPTQMVQHTTPPLYSLENVLSRSVLTKGWSELLSDKRLAINRVPAVDFLKQLINSTNASDFPHDHVSSSYHLDTDRGMLDLWSLDCTVCDALAFVSGGYRHLSRLSNNKAITFTRLSRSFKELDRQCSPPLRDNARVELNDSLDVSPGQRRDKHENEERMTRVLKLVIMIQTARELSSFDDLAMSAIVDMCLFPRKYVQEIATRLWAVISPLQPTDQQSRQLTKRLPKHLTASALHLSYGTLDVRDLGISYFLCRYRQDIQEAFESLLPHDIDTASSPNEPKNLYQERILHFLKDGEVPKRIRDVNAESEDKLVLDPDGSSIQRQVEPEHGPNDGYERLLRSVAYTCLKANLRNEIGLEYDHSAAMHEIRSSILLGLPYRSPMRGGITSAGYTITLLAKWNPREFITQQKYECTSETAVARAIAITGSLSQAQAASTSDYLSQTWPVTGPYMMTALQKIVADSSINGSSFQEQETPTRDRPATKADYVLPNGSNVLLQQYPGYLTLKAMGPAEFLVETAQQLAWLTSALRKSEHNAGVAVCSPIIRQMGQAHQRDKISENVGASFIIEHDLSYKANEGSLGRAGRCWHDMFRNPVLVAGFPILRRGEKDTGLELPLNMAARLVGSKFIDIFDDRPFVKGFSAMLVAAEKRSNFMLWHYRFNPNGGHISYLDHDMEPFQAPSIQELESLRHIVGWCDDAKYLAGAADAEYEIRPSRLPRPHAGCLLEKVSISGGYIVSGGASFAIGLKDMPIHVTPDGYIPRLEQIHGNYILLWDEKDKRGWIVNGTSALLHLVRGSLRLASQGDFATAYQLDGSELRVHHQHQPNSAVHVLIDRENRARVVHDGKYEVFEEETRAADFEASTASVGKTKKGCYLFQDYVERYLGLLEKLIDHQRQAAGKNGVSLKRRVRKHLEGWDIREIMAQKDAIPRVATIQELGYGWVDFARSIGAVTLFGRGLGELIQPARPDNTCPRWRSLPKLRYYLAASAFDMEKIVELFDDEHESVSGLKVADDLIWHCQDGRYEPSKCLPTEHPLRQHACDRIQSFYPPWYKSICRKPTRTSDYESWTKSEAFIFGHSTSLRYRWALAGTAEEACCIIQDQVTVPEMNIAPIASSASSEPLSDHSSESLEQSSQSTKSSTENLSRAKGSQRWNWGRFSAHLRKQAGSSGGN